MKERGLKEEKRGTDAKPDEGWRYNPGKAGLDAWKPDLAQYPPTAREILKKGLKAQAASKGFMQAKTGKDIAKFIKARDSLPEKLKPFVSPYTVRDYKKMGARVFLSGDGRSGYAITKKNDLVSVFSLPGAKQGQLAIIDAIRNGARTLDCIAPKLPDLYRKFGFREYKRIKWDDKYAPKGWDYERFGRPDIVFMRLEEE